LHRVVARSVAGGESVGGVLSGRVLSFGVLDFCDGIVTRIAVVTVARVVGAGAVAVAIG